MKIISKIEEFENLKGNIGLVPTMGALHQGHASLIKRSVEENEITVVSVFVNPIQFSPNEDYDKYPRTLDLDAKLCENLGVDYIFAPSPNEMYPKGSGTIICPSYDDVNKLCGKTRVGHFDGVATVVGKLFNIVHPKRAYFGKKDAQQLFIIKKMVFDLNFNIEIVPCEIIREPDGLAMSSRNKYLTTDGHKRALKISKALFKIKEMFSSGIKDCQTLCDMVFAIVDEDIEYFEIVNNDFEIYNNTDIIMENSTALIAVKIDGTRLIDNVNL